MSTQTERELDPESLREQYDLSEPSLAERIKRNWIGYLFILPSLLMFGLLFYYPLARGIRLTFYSINLGGTRTFVGLSNYAWVLTNDLVYHSIKTTLLYAFSDLTLQMVLGLLAALALNEIRTGAREWLAALVMAPYFTSELVGGVIWKWFLSGQFGFLRRILTQFGQQPIGMLYTGVWPFVSLVIATVWHDFPWSGVIYAAALLAVPTDEYEAAALDGMNRLQRFRYVTVPHLKTPTIMILAIRTVAATREFAIPFQLTGGGPVNQTMVLSILIYQISYVERYLGRGFVLGIILLLLSVIPAAIYIRGITEEEDLYV